MQPEALTERMLDAVSVQPFTPDLRSVPAAARHRRRTRSAQIGGLGLAACVVLTGTLVTVDRKPTPAPAPVASGKTRLQPGQTRVVDGDIRYRLAEPGAVPALSREKALAAYRRASTQPFTSLELIRFSNDVTGEIQPDGSVVLEYEDVLAWAFIQVGTTPAFYGGMDTPRPTDYPTDCDSVNVVRADRPTAPDGSGFGFSDCGPR